MNEAIINLLNFRGGHTMKYVLILGVLAMLLLAGCLDISGNAKAGNFGDSPEDKQIIDYFGEKYGDIRNKGPTPRILEALVSTLVVNYIPTDKVLKYSKDTDKMYVWFVYDDFAENSTIEVKFIFNKSNQTINTFTSKT